MNIKNILIIILNVSLFFLPKLSFANGLNLKLPFSKNEVFLITRGYNTPPTHLGKDKYALDFTKNECEAFNKETLAVLEGKVIKIEIGHQHGEKNYGNFVMISHINNLQTRYAHLNLVKINNYGVVNQGSFLGNIGNTGWAEGTSCPEYPGTHLHFAMYEEVLEERLDKNGKIIKVPVLKAYKPEPMSGYTNFLAGNWYESDNQLVEETPPQPTIVETPTSTSKPPSFWTNLFLNIKAGFSYLYNKFTQTTQALTEIFQNNNQNAQNTANTNQTQTTPQPPVPVIYETEWQSQSGDDILKPGEMATLWVKFKNTGNQIWKKSNVSLNIDLTKNTEAQLFYNPSWLTKKRPTRLDQEEVGLGEIGSFTFQITAPLEEKVYQPYFRPVYQDETGFHWLGSDQNVHWKITVNQEKQLDQGGSPQNEIPASSIPSQEPSAPPPPLPTQELSFDELEPTSQPETPQTQTPKPEANQTEETLPENQNQSEPPSLLEPPYVPPIHGLPDTNPPDTLIDSGPANPTTINEATFTFHSTETNSTFQCNFDNIGFIDCFSPFSISNLQDGEHLFEVRAQDQNGNIDPSPASYSWTIDTTPPSNPTLILSDPATGNTKYTRNQTVNLNISNDEEVWAWLVSLTQTTEPLPDDPNWQTTKPTNFTLSPGDGEKTIYLWVKDILDNINSSATIATINLDTTPPSSQISTLNNPINNLTFTVNWSGNDAGSGIKFYDVQYKEEIGGDWQDWQMGTQATSAEFTGLEEHTYYFRVRAIDQLDNSEDWPTDQNGDTYTKISLSRRVVINEIAWMGTQASSDDEWMELLNTTGQPIDLTGWTLRAVDGTPEITLSGTINPYNFFLLERTDDTTIKDHPAHQIYTGALSNLGEDLELRDSNGNLIDLVSAATNGGWFAGDNTTKASMERIDPNVSGNNPNNWETNDGITVYGLDALGNQIKGTAGQTNHAIISLTDITQNTILKAVNGPFKLNRKITVSAGVTLTIEPGVIIKATGDGILSIDGTLIAEGTEMRPIIFTALTDDWFGGDTNYDVDATLPTNGTWPWIIFNRTSQNSVLDHLIVRYGGYYWREGHNDGEIRVENSNVQMSNLTVEHGLSKGIHLVNSDSSINNCLIQDQREGISVEGGVPAISNCTIQFNLKAMTIVNNSQANIFNNRFINNDNSSFKDTEDAAVAVGDSYPVFQNNFASGNDFDGVSLYWLNPINQDYTLKADLPYTLNYVTNVAQGITLTLEPGVIFKQGPGGILSIDGTFVAQGTNEKPIIFTSPKDDNYGGDTNNDGNTTQPHGGDWPWIIFNRTSQNSVLDHLIVRYGGYYWREGHNDGLVRIENTDITLTNSFIEYGFNYPLTSGIHSVNSNSLINNCTLRSLDIGWWIEGGSPKSDGCSFLNNNIGIRASGGATPLITNYTFEGNGQNTNPPDLLP